MHLAEVLNHNVDMSRVKYAEGRSAGDGAAGSVRAARKEGALV